MLSTPLTFSRPEWRHCPPEVKLAQMSRHTHLWSRRFGVGGVLFGLLLAVVALGPLSPASEPQYEVRRHVLLTTSGNLPDEQGGLVTAAYKINNNIWDVSNLPVSVHFNPANSPEGQDIELMIQTSLAQWNGVAGSAFAFTFSGTSTAPATTCGSPFSIDGVNTITFVNSLSPGTLGITCTVWSPSRGPGAPLVEFDMQLNANINWGFGASVGPGQYDLASTMLHELGHAAGLAHPCGVGGNGCTPSEESSVMFPSLKAQQQKRELRADDVAAIIAAYPQAQVTATASPTPLPTVTPVPTAVPTPPGGLGFTILAPAIARD